MRIAMISNKAPQFESGGIERYLHEMVTDLVRAGNHVDSILCDLPMPSGMPRLPRQYDAAIFAGSALMYLSCAKTVRDLARRLECPAILAMVFPFEEVEFYLGPHMADRCAQEVASLAAHVDFLVVPSEYARRDCRSWGVDISRLVVIPHGGGRIRGPGPQDARLPSRLVSVARGGPLAIHKNTDAVIAAMADVCQIHPDAELVLVGPGVHGAEHTAVGVRSVGSVSDSVRLDLVRSARAVVLPSAIESFGLSIAEALGLGTPVVALNTTATPELVKHDRNGLLVDPVQQPRTVGGVQIRHQRPGKGSLIRSLLRILSPETPWVTMSESAELSVRDLSWERTTERYMQLLLNAS